MPAERTFRVFVSSTFEDFKAERSALQAKAFPNLRRYCLHRGGGFQPIDLRWGISEEASLDQRTMSICLAELRRCQRISPRPNFLLLLGDRYGWRPLPEEIPAAEFGALAAHLKGTAEAELLQRWYRLDENAAPPSSDEAGAYILLPRTGAEREYSVWSAQVERPLAAALRRAVEDLGFAEDARLRYQTSATHREIIEGALTAPDAESHVFAYLRTFDHLPEDAGASGFRDFSDGRPDADAEAWLASLKKQVRARLPENHILEYCVRWPERDLADARDQFAQRAERDLRGVIDEELAALELKSRELWEDEAHHSFGLERRMNFVGREELCARLLDYVSVEDNSPLVVHGEAGMGKTALLAEAASRLPAERLCLRFVGATPESNDLRGLLESVAAHLAEGQPFPTSLSELRPWLAAYLGRDSEARQTLLIDGFDELACADTEEEAPLWDWLPCRLGRGVRVIVSVGGTVDRPSRWLETARTTYGESALCALSPLTEVEAYGMLDSILAAHGRRLQAAQRELVLGSSSRNGSPLHLRLLAEQACRWRSFDPMPEALSPEVPGVIAAMLETLARPENHGRILVAKALGYLLASRHGLAEDELLGVLALDEEFFGDFREQARRTRQDLPADQRELPVVVWARLHADLALYLSERRADGARLLAFRDRQIAEGARRIFTTPESRARSHAMLAQLFGAPSQTEPRSSPLRRLVELPCQLAAAERWDELTDTLVRLDFVASKAAAGLSYDLLADFDRLLPRRSGHVAVAQLRHLVLREADGLRRFPSLSAQQVRLGMARFARLAPELAAQSTAMAADAPDTAEVAVPEFAAAQHALPLPLAADAIAATSRGVLAWQKGGRWTEIGEDGAPLATGYGRGTPITRLALKGDSLAAVVAQFVLLWPNWPAGAPQSIRCTSPVQAVSWSEDGSRLLMVGKNGDWQVCRRPEDAGPWPVERSGSGAGRVIEAWADANGFPVFVTAEGKLRQAQHEGYRDTRLTAGEPTCAARASQREEVFVAEADGTISMLASTGDIVWSAKLAAPARRLALSKGLSAPLLVAALGDGSLWTCVASTGSEARSTKVSRHALADVVPLAAGDRAITRDYVGGLALVPLKQPDTILAPHPLPAHGRTRALHWDADRGCLTGVDENGARFAVVREDGGWTAGLQPEVPSPTGHCVFLPDGRLISVEATLSNNKVLMHKRRGGRTRKVWPRALAPEAFQTLAAVGVSPDGAHGALVIRRPEVGGAQVCLFQTTPWRELERLELPDREAVRIAVSNGLKRMLLSFSKVANPPALWTRQGLVDLPLDGTVKRQGDETGETQGLPDLAVSADGSRYLAIDRHGALWQFDEPRDGPPVHRRIGADKLAVDLSPSGRVAAVLGHDRLLEVLQLDSTGAPRRMCELIAPWNVEALTLVPGRPLLLLGGRGAVCAYSLPNEAPTP